MKIVICDDVKADAQYLKELLLRYYADSSTEISICVDGSDLLLDERHRGFDLLFLDIYMGDSHGIEIGKQLRQRGDKGEIVLVSTSCEFGPESYEIGAAWYLTKPLDYEALAQALERMERKRGRKQTLKVHVGKDQVSLPALEIDYIETEGRRVVIHMGGRELKVYDTLENLYSQLTEEEFVRPHRSYILRMGYIDRLDGEQFLLQNGERVSINRGQRRQIRETYQNYLFRALDGVEKV